MYPPVNHISPPSTLDGPGLPTLALTSIARQNTFFPSPRLHRLRCFSFGVSLSGKRCDFERADPQRTYVVLGTAAKTAKHRLPTSLSPVIGGAEQTPTGSDWSAIPLLTLLVQGTRALAQATLSPWNSLSLPAFCTSHLTATSGSHTLKHTQSISTRGLKPGLVLLDLQLIGSGLGRARPGLPTAIGIFQRHAVQPIPYLLEAAAIVQASFIACHNANTPEMSLRLGESMPCHWTQRAEWRFTHAATKIARVVLVGGADLHHPRLVCSRGATS